MATSIITLLNDGLAAMNYAQTGGVKLDVTKFKVFRSPTEVDSLPNVPLVTLNATDLPSTVDTTSGGYTLLHDSANGGTAPNELDIVSGDTAVIKCTQAAALGDYDYDVVAIYVDAPDGLPGYAEGDEVLLGMYGARSIISKRATGSNDANTIEHLLGIQFSQIAGVININFTNAKRPYNYIREVNDISTIGIANDSTDRIWRVTRKDWTGAEDNGTSTYLVHAAKWAGDSKSFQTHNEWIPSDHTLIFNDYNTGTEDDYEVPYIANHPSDSNFTNTTTRLVVAVPTGHRYVPEPFTGLLVSFFSGTLAGRIYHVVASVAVDVSSPAVLRYISFTLATTMPQAATPGQRNVKIWAPNLDAVTQSEFNLSQTNQDTAIATAQSTADTANTRIDNLDFSPYLSSSNFGSAFSTVVLPALTVYGGRLTDSSTFHTVTDSDMANILASESVSYLTIPAKAGFKLRVISIGAGGHGGRTTQDDSTLPFGGGGSSGEVSIVEVPLSSDLRIAYAGHLSPTNSDYVYLYPDNNSTRFGGLLPKAPSTVVRISSTALSSPVLVSTGGGLTGCGRVRIKDTDSQSTEGIPFGAMTRIPNVVAPTLTDAAALTTVPLAGRTVGYTDAYSQNTPFRHSGSRVPGFSATHGTYNFTNQNTTATVARGSTGYTSRQPAFYVETGPNPNYYYWNFMHSYDIVTSSGLGNLVIKFMPRSAGGDGVGDGDADTYWEFSHGAAFFEMYRINYSLAGSLRAGYNEMPSWWWSGVVGEGTTTPDINPNDGLLNVQDFDWRRYAGNAYFRAIDYKQNDSRGFVKLDLNYPFNSNPYLGFPLTNDVYNRARVGTYSPTWTFKDASGTTTSSGGFSSNGDYYGHPSSGGVCLTGRSNEGHGVGGGGGSVPLNVFKFLSDSQWATVRGGASANLISSSLQYKKLIAILCGGAGGIGYGAGGGGETHSSTNNDNYPDTSSTPSTDSIRGAPGCVILTYLPLDYKDELTPGI